MRLLLHTCCAPCLVYSYDRLSLSGHDITAFFYNPNIHPYREFRKRYDCLAEYTQSNDIPLISDQEYGLQLFIQKVAPYGVKECEKCYQLRLHELVQRAQLLGFDGFSTTLLYSRYQNHETIRVLCENLAAKHGLSFVYDDLRKGWQQGIDTSVSLGLYRQPYCGCIFSEHERYDTSLRKKKTTKG